MQNLYNQAFEEIQKYECRSMHGQLPVFWKKADGCFVWDINNEKFLDFTSSIFVANIGHSNPSVLEAINEVVSDKLLHTYNYLNPYRLKYLKKLIQFAGNPFEKAFLASSGTEATETAFKLMRMYGFKISNKTKPGIISFNGSWHGRTLGSFMMSGGNPNNWWIGYKDPNIFSFDFPYPWEVTEENGGAYFKAQIKKLESKGVSPKKDICGFMIETFQGWGAIFYPKTYIQELVNFAKENQIQVCFDEMQAGFLRTGKKFGYEHYDVKPDLICIGKGMGSGLPISGILGKTEMLNLPLPGEMSSTNSANPLVCAAGYATIEYIEKENLLNHVSKMEKILFDGLKKISNKKPGNIFINGRGLVAAVIFMNDDKSPNINLTNNVVEECLKRNLIVVRTGRESIKLGPPLIINEKLINEGLEILKEAIEVSWNKI